MPRKSLEELGELQRAIMEIVWQLDEATVQQVREQLNRHKRLAYTSVLSVMQRLRQSGWLMYRVVGRTHVYRPRRSRSHEGSRSLKKLLKDVFGGDRRLLFEHLLDDERLSVQELDDLREKIDRKSKERRHD